MYKMHKGIKTLGIAAALLAGVWASSANATIQTDVTSALSAPTVKAKNVALNSLGKANAGNLPVFTQLAELAAAGVTNTGAAGAAGALAAGAFSAAANNDALTRILIRTFVRAHPGAGGDIFAAVIAAGGSTEVAAATLQSSLATAAGQTLGLVPTLPANNPGTGVNLLQEAFVKSLNTTRLGNVTGEQIQPSGTEPQSPSDPEFNDDTPR